LLVRDIGWKEDGKCAGLFGFGTGTTMECSQDGGILPVNQILLKPLPIAEDPK